MSGPTRLVRKRYYADKTNKIYKAPTRRGDANPNHRYAIPRSEGRERSKRKIEYSRQKGERARVKHENMKNKRNLIKSVEVEGYCSSSNRDAVRGFGRSEHDYFI